MKLILHIGIEKTGTTSLQSFLTLNKIKLEEAGVYLSSFSAIGHGNNRKLVAYFQDNFDDFHDDFGINDNQSYKDYFKGFLDSMSLEIEEAKSKKNFKAFIITSEHFHSRLKTVEELSKLKSFLDKHFKQIKIICYLREQSSLFLSLYSTYIKSGGYNDLEAQRKETVHKENPYYNFKKFLENWEIVFNQENINLNIYEQNKLFKKNICNDFTNLIGVKNNFEYPIILNSSFNLKEIEFLRAVNFYYKDNTNFRKKFLQIIKNSNILKGKKLLYSNSNLIYQQFDESNKQVFKKYFNDDSNLFNCPIIDNIELDEVNHKCFSTDEVLDIINQLKLNTYKSENFFAIRDFAINYNNYDKLNKNDAITILNILKKISPDGKVINSFLNKFSKE